MDTHRIVLTLTEQEFLALARIGHSQFRSPRHQAHFILRSELTAQGAIVYNPAPVVDESALEAH